MKLRIFFVLAAMVIFSALAAAPARAAMTFDCNTATDVPLAECEALKALYNATDGDNWVDNTNWGTSTAVCSWYGVECTIGTPPVNVQILFLSNNGLNGDVSALSFADLNLTFLDLSTNQLSGSIPAGITSMTGLQTLRLNGNNLTGTLPADLGNLTAMREFAVENNNLEGTIPASVSTWANLEAFRAGQNHFSGAFPSLAASSPNLTWLDLFEASDHRNPPSVLLTGEIGTWLNATNFPNMETLNLGNNGFTGAMPDLMGTPIRFLNLSLNPWTTGPIPAWIAASTTLEALTMSFAQRNGTLPVFQSQELTQIILEQNFLTGTIPAGWNGTAYPNLTTISLWANSLSGDIPSALGTITSLQSLFLFGNQFTSVPESFTGLSNILNPNLSNPSFPIHYLRVENNAIDPLNVSGTLADFLDAKNPGWWNTLQTVPPTTVNATAVDSDSITVNWTPRGSDVAGRWEVGVSTTDGGPYTFDAVNRTTDKATTSLTVNGLTPSTTYYFVVRMFTNFQPFFTSAVTSANSTQVSATTTGGSNPLGAFTLEFPDNAETITVPALLNILRWNESSMANSYTFTLDRPTLSDVVITDSVDDEGDIQCMMGSCIITIDGATVLAEDGVYSWSVVASDGTNTLPASNNPFTFTVDTSTDPTDPPTAPVLTSPAGNALIVGDIAPEFVWDANSASEGVTGYQLLVRDALNLQIVNAAIDPATYCNASICVVDLDDVSASLTRGLHTWRVRATNAVGSTNSAWVPFTVQFPEVPTLMQPPADETVTFPLPEFIWGASSGADEYRVRVIQSGVLVASSGWQPAATLCIEATCTWTPDTGLANGAYAWRVDVRSSLLPGRERTAASAFTVAFPEKATLISPVGITGDIDLTMLWEPVANAAQYRVRILRGGIVVENSGWLDAATACATVCEWDPSIDLLNGVYAWRVEARNLALSPNRSRSDFAEFTLEFPAEPQLQFPGAEATVDVASPALTWAPADGATAYRIILRNRTSSPAVRVFRVTVAAGDVCDIDICTFDLAAQTPPTVLRDGRTYDWRVQARETVNGVLYVNNSERRIFSVTLP